MKNNLLLLSLFATLIWLPNAHAQVLTEIQDTNTELRKSPYYVILGYSIRADFGYQQMRDFYEGQGFDDISVLENHGVIGGGLLFGDGFSVELLAELGADSDETRSGLSELSLNKANLGLHTLLGYNVWKAERKRLFLQAGLSGLGSIVSINEQRSGTFDFNDVNAANAPMVRSWPTFTHWQGGLHFALQYKLSYPRSALGSSDLDIRLGYVTAQRSKEWSLDPGQGLNIPTDRAQYLYFSATYHFFFRTRR